MNHPQQVENPPIPHDQGLTQINLVALLLLLVGLLGGFIGGYIARPHLLPQDEPKEEADVLQLNDAKLDASFPYTFANRREAVNWLRHQIAFLDRHSARDSESQARLTKMKKQLREIEDDSTSQLPKPLFVVVNEDVMRTQELLLQYNPAPPVSTVPLAPAVKGTRERPRVEK